MAWGSAKSTPAPKSAFAKLTPVVILFLFLGLLAFVGLQVYGVINNIADTTNKKMEKKNITLTKDGMKVGIKEVNAEAYVDQTQRQGSNCILVKAWNFSTWPAYKSRLWNQEAQQKTRKGYSKGAGKSTEAKA